MQIVKDEVKTLLRLPTVDNVVIFPRSKTRLLGDLPIRYAAIVLVTLIISYKLVSSNFFLKHRVPK